jgi:cell wall-associated NlpC family hydrolase
LSERAPARHRADLPPSTPLTGITSSISSVVGDRAATIGRGGVVVAVSSGLVTGLGLPAAAATTVVGDTGQTASVPLLAGPAASGVPATADVLASAPVTAPTKARISFDHSAFTAVAKGGVAAGTPLSATRDVARISRSLARAAYRAAKPANPAVPSATSPRRSSTGTGGVGRTGTGNGTPSGSQDGTGDGVGVGSGGTTKPVPPAPVDDQTGVVAIALRYLGIAYRYGGTTPRGFDCSGFTQYVFAQLGVSLARSADGQYQSVTRIARSQAVPGDLVFYLGGGGAYHVGIYLGGNRMIAAPHTGAVVRVQDIYSANIAFGRP